MLKIIVIFSLLAALLISTMSSLRRWVIRETSEAFKITVEVAEGVEEQQLRVEGVDHHEEISDHQLLSRELTSSGTITQ